MMQRAVTIEDGLFTSKNSGCVAFSVPKETISVTIMPLSMYKEYSIVNALKET